MKRPAAVVVVLLMTLMSAVQGAAADKKASASKPNWIVETVPAIGATSVDPKLTEITVTFDRDMGEGMSWTGNEDLIPADPAKKASWKDKRTCVLPVKLKRGQFYCVGINSKSYLNFKSSKGEAAPCSAFYFVTRGATMAVQNRTKAPAITKLVPTNGNTEVDPDLKAIRVTFNMPMNEGMSWVGGGASFPEGMADQKPKWTSDGKTCIMPVTLKANNEYKLGLNSLRFINFQSKWGVPLAPVEYRFKTTATD